VPGGQPEATGTLSGRFDLFFTGISRLASNKIKIKGGLGDFKEMRLYVFSDPSLSPPDPVASRPTHLPELTILHGPNHLAVEI
jgi:hypothetical protein